MVAILFCFNLGIAGIFTCVSPTFSPKCSLLTVRWNPCRTSSRLLSHVNKTDFCCPKEEEPGLELGQEGLARGRKGDVVGRQRAWGNPGRKLAMPRWSLWVGSPPPPIAVSPARSDFSFSSLPDFPGNRPRALLLSPARFFQPHTTLSVV